MFKIGYLSAGPIQNVYPFVLISDYININTKVVYLDVLSHTNFFGDENLTKQAFKHNVYDGYHSITLKQKNKIRKGTNFFDYSSRGVWYHLRDRDCVIIYGHYLFVFWVNLIRLKLNGRKAILTTDATNKAGEIGSNRLKRILKPLFLKFLYNILADGVFVPSTSSYEYLINIGINKNRISITPYVVDERLFADVEKNLLKNFQENLFKGVKPDFIYLFCAKFIDRKAPVQLVASFLTIFKDGMHLIMIGDGPLKNDIENLIENHKAKRSIHLIGIIEYTQLKYYYSIADITVFPSTFEPYGLPVNESLLMGTPIIVSDAVGAAKDLVEPANTGWIFPSGNFDKMTELMEQIYEERDILPFLKQKCIEKMLNWSSKANVEAQLDYFSTKEWIKN